MQVNELRNGIASAATLLAEVKKITPISNLLEYDHIKNKLGAVQDILNILSQGVREYKIDNFLIKTEGQ